MTSTEIRQMIAESGKTTIKDMVNYVMHRRPDADKKAVRAEAKELRQEMKAYL